MANLRTIVIQTESESVSVRPVSASANAFSVDFELPEPLFFFDEVYYVRLAHYEDFSKSPRTKSLLVYTDFTQGQAVDGVYKGFLGVTEKAALNEYVSISAAHLNKYCRLILEAPLGTTKLSNPPKALIVLHVAPLSFIYGAKGTTSI